MMTNGALHGVRVVELGGPRLEYAGKLLANLGASVIKVEPPGGDPTRAHLPRDARRPEGLQGLVFNHHNAGKRSLTLDFAAEAASGGATLRRLAAWAQIVLTDRHADEWSHAGAPWDELRAANPALIIVAVTDFGLDGPKRGWHGADIVAMAAGGLLALSGEPEGPPYQLAGSQAFQTAGAYGAANALIALAATRAGQPGQVIDISLQEAVVSLTTLVGVPKMLADGVPTRRQHNGRASGGHPTGLYAASDGLVSLSLSRAAMWPKLAGWIHEVTGNSEVLDPMFEGSGLNRQQHADIIDIFIEEMTRQFPARELFEEGQRRGLAFALVSTPEDLLDDPHLAARAFWIQVPGEHGRSAGVPFRLERGGWVAPGPAPAPGQHTAEILAELPPVLFPVPPSAPAAATSAPPPANRGALAGLRVVEFTVAGAGPWVGRHLSYHGAEVIRVEAHGHPDHVRMFVPPWDPGRGVDPQASPWLAEWNAGKLNAGLNLRAPGGRELGRRLCLSAEVVIENHRPGFLAGNGLGYASLAAENPRLIMLSMQGYGTSGPYHRYLSWGYNLEPMAGISAFSGGPERPMTSPVAYSDWLAGLHGVVAVTAALHERERSGLGQDIELAQVEMAISVAGGLFRDFAANGTPPERIGNRSRNHAPQGVFRGADRPGRNGHEDTWLAVAITDDAQWAALCDHMGRPEWRERYATTLDRLEAQDAIERALAGWIRDRDVAGLAAELQALGIPAHLAQDSQDLADDPHLRQRQVFRSIPHAAKGEQVVTGLAGRFSGTPTGVPYSGGRVGSDNRRVFIDMLGLTDHEFATAVAAGAIEQPAPAGVVHGP